VINGKKALFRVVRDRHRRCQQTSRLRRFAARDEIVVGSYKALRTLKPESQVKVDNSRPKKQDDQQS